MKFRQIPAEYFLNKKILLLVAVCIGLVASSVWADTTNSSPIAERIKATMFGLLPDANGWNCTRNAEQEEKRIATRDIPIVIANCDLAQGSVELTLIFDKGFASLERYQIDRMADSPGAAITRFYEAGSARLMSTSEGFEGVIGDRVVVKAIGIRARPEDPEPIEVLDSLAKSLVTRKVDGLFATADIAGHDVRLAAVAADAQRRASRLDTMVEFPAGVVSEQMPVEKASDLGAVSNSLSVAWLPAASRVGTSGDCRILASIDASPDGIRDAQRSGWASSRVKDGETLGNYHFVKRDGYVEREFPAREILALVDEKVFVQVVFLEPELCTEKSGLLRQTLDLILANDPSEP